MTVTHKHPEYSEYLPVWKQNRDAAAGSRAIKKGAETYLPVLSGHSGAESDEYKGYLARAYYYNATGRTIDALSGMVFQSEPEITMPESLSDFVDDVTLSGCSLTELANEILEDLLRVDRYGLLVDFEGSTEGLTRAQADAQNKRPKLVGYRAEDITNWRYGRVNGVYQLTLVVLKEYVEAEKDAGGFETETAEQYRVLRLVTDTEVPVYFQELWVASGTKGKFTLAESFTPRMNGQTFDQLPFRIFAQNAGPSIETAAMSDLIEANLAHYRTSADYEHATHMVGLPMIFGSGFALDEGESVPVGSAVVYTREDPGAKMEFLEFTGAGLGELRANLDRKENHMASLGARLLQEASRAVETAQAVQTKQTGENSVLASLAKATSKGLTWAMRIAVEWQGGTPDEVDVQLQTDYLPDTVDAATLTSLLKAVQQGNLSKESFAYNLQRGGYLPPEKTIDEELDDIEQGDIPPAFPGLPSIPGEQPPTGGPADDDDA